jgi:hypothetical protein
MRRLVRQGIPVFMVTAAAALVPAAPSDAGTPRSFFTIHCDPNESQRWADLERLVDLANRWTTPLTIEFTPQWAQVVVSDPTKLQQVRAWQTQGHEFGAHHHGIYHAVWDHFTNYPAPQIVAQGWPPASLEGDMQDFAAMLEIIAGDSLLFTYGGPGGDDPAPEVDWLPGSQCKTFGGRDVVEAFSSPQFVTFGAYTACQIGHCYIPDGATVDAIQAQYAAMPEVDVVGVVTHVFNYAADSTFVIDWLQSVQSTRRLRARDIVREGPCAPPVDVVGSALPRFSLAPNPGHSLVEIAFTLPVSAPVTLRIVDVGGRVVRVLAASPGFAPGWHRVSWDGVTIAGRRASSGVYFAHLEVAGKRSVQRITWIR